jgi:hypothetical protein
MPKSRAFFGVLALIFAISAGFLMPASARFFGCNDKPARLLASYHSSSGGSRYTCEFSAQSRPRVTIHPRPTRPGPNSKRYCRSWLAKEYRVSGPVIVPQMRCWWE